VNGLVLFLVCAAAAAFFALLQLLGPRSDRIRRAVRGVYTTPAIFYTWQASVGVYPLWAGALAMCAVFIVAPAQLTAWLVVPAFALFTAAVALSYMTPPPFTPGWLRAEITAGVTPLLRPGRLDWLAFVVLVPFFVFGTVAILLANLGVI
jgi:hypothetical protein